MRRSSGILRVLLVGAALVSCRREPGASAAGPQDAALASPATDAPSTPRPAVQAARCRPTDRALQLDDGAGLDELDIGNGVPHAGGYAIGLIHRSSAGRVAAVARMDAAATEVRIVDLAPAFGDAPPPRLTSCRDQLVAAVFVRPSHATTQVNAATYVPRDLALYFIGAQGPDPAVIHVPQRSDESLALDLACSGASGLAVWDETAMGAGSDAAPQPFAARGVVRGASFQVGQRSAVVNDLSPPESDAEMPRAVPNGDGFLVFWIARRPESSRAADGSANIEAVGEARAFGWLEMVAVDVAGKVTGPVRRLTSVSGHVSTYDALAHLGPARPEVLVVARDDAESVDGAGGALIRVHVSDDGADSPSALLTDGLGRGAPAFVEAPLPWLSWVGPNEDVRLLPLDGEGEIAGSPSAEQGLDEARVLFSLAPGSESRAEVAPAPGRVLVATPRDKAAQLRVFDCSR